MIHMPQLMPMRRSRTTSRVLLVDDGDSGELVRAVLEDGGLEVVAVANAEDAVDALRTISIDLVIIDCGDQDIHGRQTASDLAVQLRGRGSTAGSITRPRTPIIVLTHYNIDMAGRRLLSQYGVAWVLQKPFVPTSLPKLVRHTVGEYARQRTPSLSRLVDMGESASQFIPAVSEQSA
ncbi:MAG TPA: response regulator [Planctomycetota bacterium]|nr:response regulator [Planctomycetota bacterium]